MVYYSTSKPISYRRFGTIFLRCQETKRKNHAVPCSVVNNPLHMADRSFFGFLTPENGSDRSSRNVNNKLTLLAHLPRGGRLESLPLFLSHLGKSLSCSPMLAAPTTYIYSMFYKTEQRASGGLTRYGSDPARRQDCPTLPPKFAPTERNWQYDPPLERKMRSLFAVNIRNTAVCNVTPYTFW